MNTLTDLMDILDNMSCGPRGSYRASMHGLHARLNTPEALHPVKDISDTGLSIFAPAESYPVGSTLEIQLEIKGHCIVTGLTAMVVRHQPNLVACTFSDLSAQQECILDKLVLEIQKREIRHSKMQGVSEQSTDTEEQK